MSSVLYLMYNSKCQPDRQKISVKHSHSRSERWKKRGDGAVYLPTITFSQSNLPSSYLLTYFLVWTNKSSYYKVKPSSGWKQESAAKLRSVITRVSKAPEYPDWLNCYQTTNFVGINYKLLLYLALISQ